MPGQLAFAFTTGCLSIIGMLACGPPNQTTNTASARRVPEDRCTLGHDESCLRYAIDLYLGTEGIPDEKRAFGIFESMCTSGPPGSGACILTGIVLVNGRGIAADPLRAQQLFREACDADVMVGCQLAKLRVPTDRPPTLRDVEYAVAICDMQTALGCKFAGAAFLTGQIVPIDRARGLKLLDRACQADDFDACMLVGGASIDKPASREEAVRGITILERACQRRHGPSCTLLGLAYVHGTSASAPDETVAVSYFRGACDVGDRDGCASLAISLAKGTGVPKDLAQARAILEQQCRDGHGPSCGKWGALFLQENEPALARQGLERGCLLGDAVSCNALKQLSNLDRSPKP